MAHVTWHCVCVRACVCDVTRGAWRVSHRALCLLLVRRGGVARGLRLHRGMVGAVAHAHVA
eukprot:5972901-Alexandrium_andersonii.AAC.1